MASLERAAGTKVAHRRDHDGCGPARRGKSANTFDSDPSFPMERLMLIFILMIVILTPTLPVEAQQADKGLPEPGTRWVARVASPAGVNTFRLTAVGEDLYKGRPVYRVRVEEGVRKVSFSMTMLRRTLSLSPERAGRNLKGDLGSSLLLTQFFSSPITAGSRRPSSRARSPSRPRKSRD